MEPTAQQPALLDRSGAQTVALLLIQGDEQRAALEAELADLARLRRELFEQKASTDPWDAGEEKAQLWELEDQIPLVEEALRRRVENVVSLYGRALELDPERAEARARLSDLYWRLVCLAEEQGRDGDLQRYLQLLALHDDGRYADLIEGTATLQVSSDPDGARVCLSRIERQQRRLQPLAPVDLGLTPVQPVDLAPGSYLLEIKLKGCAVVRRPLVVERGVDLAVQVRLCPSRLVGPDFVVVPASRFRMGGDLEAPGALPPQTPFLDNFAIGRFPVTVGEYELFLDDLAADDPGQALRFTPGSIGLQERRDPRRPVVDVSLVAARAYCEWISARTGIVHRLPSEAEWEKAARGAAGWTFPWGDDFDPSFCHMRRSHPGTPQRLPVGSLPGDVSIYGVRDLGGGVREWTTDRYRGQADEAEQQTVRGGSFEDDAESCRSAQRCGVSPTRPHGNVGFRLVRPLPPGGGDRAIPAVVPQLIVDDLVFAPALPVRQERLSITAALERVRSMSSRLASSTEDPRQLLRRLLGETIQLVDAERGLLLERRSEQELRILEACSAAGEPLPSSDQGYDHQVALAALRQARVISLDIDETPVLAVPLPGQPVCLLLERRFKHVRLGEEAVLIAQAAADALSLALRLAPT